jgi:tetratricopeptide (TPR) repeat protein
MVMLKQSMSKQQPHDVNALNGERFFEAGDQLYRRYFEPTESENCLQAALNAYSQALEQSPDCLKSLCGMAKTFLLLGQYAKAEQSISKALALLEQSAPPRALKRYVLYEAACIQGTIEGRRGDRRKAARFFYGALQWNGFGSSRARYGLFECLQSLGFSGGLGLKSILPLLQAGYFLSTSLLLLPFETEKQSLRQWLALLPQYLWGWFQEETGQSDAALKIYLRVFRNYPGLAGLSSVIGNLYQEKDEPEIARYWFEKGIERHPADLDAYHYLVRLLEQDEDAGKTIPVYEKMLRLAPTNPHLWCNLANACYYAQQYKEALNHYKTAFHLGTNAQWRATVAQSMGNLQAEYLQNAEAGIACYEIAKTLAPADIENYIQLGMLYFQKEDYTNAELIYRQALALAPENPRLYSNMGYLRWMEDDVEGAIGFYQQAIALDPHYEIPLNNLGVIHLDMLGQVQKAIELFEQALEAEPNYALAYYNLGRAYSFVDNRLEAASCFRQAQALNLVSRELDNDDLTARINNLFNSREIELRD